MGDCRGDHYGDHNDGHDPYIRDLKAEVAYWKRAFEALAEKTNTEVERLREQNAGLYKDRAAQGLEVERLTAELEGETLLARDMVAEVERLRAELKSTHDYAEVVRQEGERLLNEVERLREQVKYAQGGQYVAVMQENERLRAALERIDQYGNRMSPESKMARAALAKEVTTHQGWCASVERFDYACTCGGAE